MKEVLKYKVISEKQLKDINSQGTLLVHEKSGAKVFLLENEEENKGKEKSVINLQKRLSVKEEQSKRNYDKSYPIWHKAEYHKNRNGKKCKINTNSADRKTCCLFLNFQGLVSYEYQTAHCYKHNRHTEGREHNAYKLTVGNIELGVKIKILWIAKRCEHTAKICRNVLHNKCKGKILFLLRCVEDKVSEREKRQQSHIVGNKHRTDEGYVNQSQNCNSCVSELSNDSLGKSIEESDVSQRTYHGKNTEKTGQSFKVEIVDIFLVWWYYNRGNNRCQNSYNENNILFNQPEKFCGFVLKITIRISHFCKSLRIYFSYRLC